jgi:hypothetical protein
MLPISTVNKEYQEPSGLSQLMGNTAGIMALYGLGEKTGFFDWLSGLST